MKKFTIVAIVLVQMVQAGTMIPKRQSVTRVTVAGRIIDGATKEPLHFVNVFIVNTTRGAATDEQGNFSIVNIPMGTYELAASMVGYTFFIQPVQLKKNDSYTFDIELFQEPIQGKEVSVEARYPHEWKANLKKFQSAFFGQSDFAPKCHIENPEIMDFENNRQTGILHASATGPLHIDNRALGYKILFYLDDFMAKGNLVSFLYKSVFKPLPSSDSDELVEWEKNRAKTYFGSIRHFLRPSMKTVLEMKDSSCIWMKSR